MSMKNIGPDEAVTIRGSVSCVTFPVLDALGFVKHGFMLRTGGVSGGPYSSLNLSYTVGDKKENVDENFRRAAAFFDTVPGSLVSAYQTHGTDVMRVGKEHAGSGVSRERLYPDSDGLLTDEPGLVLTTSHADCTPVFLADPAHRAVGLVHSGWRGTAGLIAAGAVRAMQKEFGTDPADIVAVIGPCICGGCYEVGAEVADIFISRYGSLAVFGERYCTGPMLRPGENGRYMLDQKAVNFRILSDAGVRKENISVSRLCTFEDEDMFFSHRKMRGKRGNSRAFISVCTGDERCPEKGTRKIYCSS